MEEIFWMVQQFTHALFDARSRSHSHWRDAAERDISARYVNPLYENADEINAAVRRMYECLTQVKSDLAAAHAHLATAREQSQKVDNATETFRDHTNSAESLVTHAEHELQEMYGDLLNVGDLLEIANTNGAAAQDENGNYPIFTDIHELISVYKVTEKDAAIPGLKAVDALVSQALGLPFDPNSTKFRVISDY